MDIRLVHWHNMKRSASRGGVVLGGTRRNVQTDALYRRIEIFFPVRESVSLARSVIESPNEALVHMSLFIQDVSSDVDVSISGFIDKMYASQQPV